MLADDPFAHQLIQHVFNHIPYSIAEEPEQCFTYAFAFLTEPQKERLEALGTRLFALFQRNLWKSDFLPPAGTMISQLDALKFQIAVIGKVKCAWVRFSLSLQKEFRDSSPLMTCFSPELFNSVLRIYDREDLLDIVRTQLPALFHQIGQFPLRVQGLSLIGAITIHGGLRSLPECIGELSSLTNLDISFSPISSLPSSFTTLVHLKDVVLSHNILRSLSPSFGNLVELKSLWLNDNLLTTIPESFENLKQLTELHLEENRLISLPEQLSTLSQLKILDIRGNPLNMDPAVCCTIATLHAMGCKVICDNAVEESVAHFLRLAKEPPAKRANITS